MTETKVPKAVSAYFRKLARKANARIVPGSPEAKARTAKAREVLKKKRAERKALAAAK
jgi:homoserine kinase